MRAAIEQLEIIKPYIGKLIVATRGRCESRAPSVRKSERFTS